MNKYNGTSRFNPLSLLFYNDVIQHLQRETSMKKTCVISIACLPLLTPFVALADPAEDLKAKLANIDHLKAHFNQTVTDVNQKRIQTGEGIIALAQPNRFYWHLTAPDESLIVADGTDVWIYNPFSEEVTVMGIDQAMSASPIALLVRDDATTWGQYQISRQDHCFSIKPIDKEAAAADVQVCFDGNKLTDIILDDQQGNVSHFTLSQQTHMISSEERLFQFVIPDDLDPDSIDDQRLLVTH